MEPHKAAAVACFSRLLERYRRVARRCTVSLVEFADDVGEVYRHVDAGAVPPLVPSAAGPAALYDAVAALIASLTQQLSALPEDERPGTVVIVVITAGNDDASQRYDRAGVRELVHARVRDDGWHFECLPLNADAPATTPPLLRPDGSRVHRNVRRLPPQPSRER